MEKVFLSFHFDDTAREIADQLENLIDSHLLRTVTGQRLGGDDVWEAIERKIDSCDALICMMTARDSDKSNDWIEDERKHALDKKLRVLTILQKGLPKPSGKYAGREYIVYDPEDKAQLFLDVSATLGEWRRDGGRFLSVYIEPDEVVSLVRDTETVEVKYRTVEVKYRTVDNRGDETDWINASVQPELGGATVYLKGVPDDRKLQLEMSNADERWKSDYVPQTLPVRLRKIGG